ncbi:ATP-binding protein [Spirochaetota bacterium]
MQIQIHKIKKLSSGVISKKFEETIAPLTVIYGLNEKGKSSIVEGIIRSLFTSRQCKLFPSLRFDDFPQTDLEVGMIIDDEHTNFTPNSREKLDDILQDRLPNIPEYLCKLLIVKSAELEIAYEGEGIDKAVIQKYLSDKWIIDHMKTRLDKELKGIMKGDLDFNDGKVHGPRTYASVKQWDMAFEEYSTVSGYLERVEEISAGELSSFDRRIGKLNDQKSAVKRDTASMREEIDAAIKHIQNHAYVRNRNAVNDIENAVFDLKRCTEEYDNKKAKLIDEGDTAKKGELLAYISKHYHVILDRGIGKYSGRRLSFAAFALLSISAILSIYFKMPLIILPGLVFGSVLFLVMLILSKAEIRNKKMIYKLDDLKKDYKNAFNETLTSSALEIRQRDIDKRLTEINMLKEDIAQIKADIQKKQYFLVKEFIHIGVEIQERNEPVISFERVLHNIQNEIISMEEKKERLIQERESISVQAVNKIDALDTEIKELENKKNVMLKQESDLKSEIEGRLKISGRGLGWGEIIDHLHEEREHRREELKKTASRVIAGKKLRVLLENIEGTEDEIIKERLSTPAISDKLKVFTDGSYKALDFNGNEIIVTDNKSNYLFKNLSTGCKEQILLALRLGMVEHIVKGNRIFFILDDAFQYSDWKRREHLIRQTVEMVKGGMQVIYFSMDTHIDETFRKHAKERLKTNEYRFITL